METCPLCRKPLGDWAHPHVCAVVPAVVAPEEVKPLEPEALKELVHPDVLEKDGILQRVIVSLQNFFKAKTKPKVK